MNVEFNSKPARFTAGLAGIIIVFFTIIGIIFALPAVFLAYMFSDEDEKEADNA